MHDDQILQLINRKRPLFHEDLLANETDIKDALNGARILVIGAAGTIGKAVTKEIFAREPAALHAVDVSENNLVELVRDLRSSLGYVTKEFKTFALDALSEEFDLFFKFHGPYDYIFNLSALKHVRSEKDIFTLSRMFRVNIELNLKLQDLAEESSVQKLFVVSTDKAANPANLMGASKRLMEIILLQQLGKTRVSFARFANVAFSDGSLPFGFSQRLQLQQPMSAPRDIKRYFVTQRESGILCVFSALFGESSEIFFPRLSEDLHQVSFSELAISYLQMHGFEAIECQTEDEARSKVPELIPQSKWPCYFFKSDTAGEKPYEEFYTANDTPDFARYKDIGVIKSYNEVDYAVLESVKKHLLNSNMLHLAKEQVLELVYNALPSFSYIENGKNLDQKM